METYPLGQLGPVVQMAGQLPHAEVGTWSISKMRSPSVKAFLDTILSPVNIYFYLNLFYFDKVIQNI